MRTSRPAQPTDRLVWRQAARPLCCLAGAVLALAGCTGGVEGFYDSKLSLDHPVDWWHQLQGGPIADERPPPPGITDPYPNFASVPPKPVPTDAATRAGLSAQLTAQRDRARLLAAQDPVAFPARPAAAAPVTAPAAPASPDPDKSTMVLEAASTAPPAAPAARPAPPASDPAAPAAFSAPPASSGPVMSGPIPPVPATAPALPNLPGLPTADAAPVVARARPQASFRFAPGSAALPEPADQALRALAASSAGGPIAVSAGGDAASATPAAQGAALPLALRRTGAMSAALIAAGVSRTAIRAEALAPGRDAVARLVD